ncbi:DNA mismatch repair protein MutS [Pilobolus umbonatus]|nr:DNA mismatch repair protein MutS [Pilobolus umbonatus]
MLRYLFHSSRKQAINGTLRNFSSSSAQRKKVSTLNLTELVNIANPPMKALEERLAPTGSVVFDTVKKYTQKYPLCVLLVQVGDFYELYDSHATKYASQLDLKLTKKNVASGVIVDFAGFPVRSLDRYLDILVNRLQCRVALCEQVGPVTREDRSMLGFDRRITRIITPGTVIEERFLESNQYNYLLAIYPGKNHIGLAWVDISLGEFVMQRTTIDRLKDDIARIRPREVVLPQSRKPSDEALEKGLSDLEAFDPITKLFVINPTITLSYESDSYFDARAGGKSLQASFGSFTEILPDYSEEELAAAMALMTYVDETHINRKPKWQKPTHFHIEDTVCIDSAAMTSLELITSLQGRRVDSLLGVMDSTTTSAGSRLLSRWISSPLTNAQKIRNRLSVVEFFTNETFVMDDVRSYLRQSTDAQRAFQRLALKKGQHSDLMEVWSTLNVIRAIRDKLKQVQSEVAQTLGDSMDPHIEMADYIINAFNYEKIQSKGNREYDFVNHSFHPSLSQLHHRLNQLELDKNQLQTSLKSVCGNSATLLGDGALKHMVEVSSRQAEKLEELFPDAKLIHSIKSKKRYQVKEWMNISAEMEMIQSEIIEIEGEVFEEVVDKLLDQSTSILQSCRKLAELDILAGFAKLAVDNSYVQPRITTSNRTIITGGRHPVVESNLAKKGKAFTGNDCDLGADQLIWLLTGPNMGGKSTFLRQYVLIILMAHVGSFVPADRAWISVTDRVFSRVGAADNLANNQSTFMVEMSEVADILRHATSKSTVIMDEVGRGTSTADGFSLALGILDYLHDKIKCKTLFATHYHELADKMNDYKRTKCFRTMIDEDKSGNFRFIHKIEPGVCRQSHGLKVARLAGLPDAVINKAEEVWKDMSHTF